MIDPLGEEGRLWASYRASQTVTNRNKLVVYYMPLTARAGHWVNRGMRPGTYDPAELAGYAAFGLMQAVERYDSTNTEVSFRTFAWTRLVGSIYDELRRVNAQSRQDLKNTGLVAQARAILLGAGSPINDATLAVALDMSVIDVRKLLDVLNQSQRPQALETFISDLDQVDKPLQLASKDSDPSQKAESASQVEMVQETLARLTGREAAVIELHDFQGLTLAVIGVQWGVTESRICQIRASALLHLRALLENAGF